MGYTVIRRLARGGMGVVDLARAEDGAEVALKRLAIGGTAEEMRQARSRFERELDVLRRLDHEAVVPMLDVLDDAGEVVLVMPYLSGGNLAERVERDGPRSADEVLTIAGRLLPALAAAHRLGIVHRDIKPANVLFDADGQAHLADFGVAQTRDLTVGLTSTGSILGTPGFLSPEQARGEAVGPPSDVASLGATLHFAATGRSPYEGGDAHAVVLRTARGRGRIGKDLDPRVRSLVTAMTQPRPERRPTAAALCPGAAGTNPIPRLPPRRRWLVVAGTGVTLGAVAVLGVVARTGADGAASDGTTTEPPCQALPYRPCGGPVAPHTDGRVCVDDHADYDGLAANGCEAEPDDVDGAELLDGVTATIVPAADTDSYPVHIDDHGDLGCDNTFRLELTAPTGMTLRVELVDGAGTILGQATSADRVPGSIEVRDPRCFRDDTGTFRAVVRATGSDRSGEPYVLTRTGSF